MDSSEKTKLEDQDPSNPSDCEEQSASLGVKEAEWISGVKLWMVISGVALVCFLMLLDISILGTVSMDPIAFHHDLG